MKAEPTLGAKGVERVRAESRPPPVRGPAHPSLDAQTAAAPLRSLDRVAPGTTVEVAGSRDVLSAVFREQLLAYGVQSSQRLTILQQTPMTIVMCDHVELALERPVARMIEVRGLL